MTGADPPGAVWTATLAIAPDEELRSELGRRRMGTALKRSVGVSELLDLRSAYYERVSPVPLTPERRQRVEAGREAHLVVGWTLAKPSHLEVRVQRSGIVGQIDLYDSRPTEIKTTSSLPEEGQILGSRPQYIEQLAMYCALVGRPDGRLLLVLTREGEVRDDSVFDVQFGDLEGIMVEMVERADRLRSALADRSPRSLPACEWRGRACPFEVARVCECDGSEVPPTHSLSRSVRDLRHNPEETERTRALLTQAPREPPVVRRFRDLLYPRRVFFERTRPELSDLDGGWRPDPNRDDLYRQVSELLESGPPGEVTREAPPGGVPPESVACYRGSPFLLKISRGWTRPSATELLTRQPQYFLELGLRCASLGRPEGRLLIGYERAESWPERLAAYRVTFAPLETMQRTGKDRAEGLEAAIAAGDPTGLAPCPSWMFERCDYRVACGCGSSPGDSPGA